MILIIKFLRMRAGIYMLYPLVGWKKVLFHGEKAGKRVFFIKTGLEFYICHRWTPCVYMTYNSFGLFKIFLQLY